MSLCLSYLELPIANEFGESFYGLAFMLTVHVKRLVEGVLVPVGIVYITENLKIPERREALLRVLKEKCVHSNFWL